MPYTISAEESRRFNVSRALEILPDAPDAEKVWGVRTLAGQARMTLPAEFTSNPSDALSRLQEAYRTNSIEPLQTDDFKETEQLLREGNWDELAKRGAKSESLGYKAGDALGVDNDTDIELLDEADRDTAKKLKARIRDIDTESRIADMSGQGVNSANGTDQKAAIDLYNKQVKERNEIGRKLQPLVDEARKRAAAMRHVQRVRQKNAFTLLNSISGDLDDRTREIVDRAVANGYRLADGDEDAFALPEERGGLPESQKELAASFLLYCKPVEGKGAWDAFLKRMGDNAAQVVGNTASGVGDLFSGVFHGFDKDSYRDRVNRRAWINRINARNFADLGTLGNSFAEAGGIIGYWTPQLIGGAVGRGTRLLAGANRLGAVARVAGKAVGVTGFINRWGPEAMYFADYRQQFLERVALDGGDVTNPAFQVAATVGAAASAYVEHIQWGRAMGQVGLEEVQAQAYAKLSHRILAKLGIKVGTEFGSMTAGRAARLVLMERGLSAVTEGFEEAIQQAIEETVVQIGDGNGFRLADIADQSGEAFVSTLGPMMWTMMFGLPFRAKSAATMHNLDGDAIDRLMSAGSRLKRLAAEGKLDQGGDDLASLNELLFVTSRAPNADAGVRSLRERGFSQRQAADIWNTFEAIKREAIQHGQMEALGRNVLPTREELERTGWTVNPDMTASRMVETADGRKRRQTIKVRTEASQAVNIADDEQAASSLNTIRQDVEGRMAPSVNEDGTPGAIPLADKIASTYGFDLSLDNEAILANPAMREGLARYAADNDLRIAGNTRLVETRKAKGADGAEIDEDVFDVPLTEKATRQTIFHEVAHAVATTLRNMGLSEKEIDAIQNWRSGLDGKAPSEADLALPQVAGEAWDEERVGDELGDLITEPDARGRVAKAMNFIGDMTRRILGIQKQQNDLHDAVSVLRAAVERGFFGNIDDLNDAQRRVLLAARQKRAEDREKRKAEPPAPAPAEGAVIAPAPPPEETNTSEIPTGSESQTDAEEETPPAEEPKSALERGQDAFVAGRPLQTDEMAALAASGDVGEDEIYATGYRWHYAANAWVIAPEAVGQAFVPSGRYMGLDGQMHDAADFAGDAEVEQEIEWAWQNVQSRVEEMGKTQADAIRIELDAQRMMHANKKVLAALEDGLQEARALEGLDGEAGDASFDFGQNAITTDEHLQALEEEMPEEFDRFQVASDHSRAALADIAAGKEYGILHNEKYGEIRYPLGRAGKKGMGFLHIVEHRMNGGATLDDAIQTAIRVGIAAEIGKETANILNTRHLEFDGTKAIVAIRKKDSAVITGYEIDADETAAAVRRAAELAPHPHVSSEEVIGRLREILAQTAPGSQAESSGRPKVAAKVTPMTDDEVARAVEMFGTTDDPNNAAYILPDGRWLDMDQMGEHWEISQAFGAKHKKDADKAAADSGFYGDAEPYVLSALGAGLVRTTGGVFKNGSLVETGIQFGMIPGAETVGHVERFLDAVRAKNPGLERITVDGLGLDGRWSRQYGADEADAAIRDIRQYAATGTEPRESLVARFHGGRDAVSSRPSPEGLDAFMGERGFQSAYHGTVGKWRKARFGKKHHGVSAFYLSAERGPAEGYAALRSLDTGEEQRPSVRKFYVKGDNVLRIEEANEGFDEFAAALRKAKEDGYAAVFVKGALDDQRFRLDKKGNIVYPDGVFEDAAPADIWVVFDPESLVDESEARRMFSLAQRGPSQQFAQDGTIADAIPAHMREDARAIIAERANTPAWMADPDGTPTDLSERDWLRSQAERRHNAERFVVKQKKAGEPDGNLVAVHFVGMNRYFSMIDAGGKLIAPSIAVSDADSPRYWGAGVNWAEPDSGVVFVMKPETLDNADGNVDIFGDDAGTPMVQMLDDENVTDPAKAVEALKEFRGGEIDNVLQGFRTFDVTTDDAFNLALALRMRKQPGFTAKMRRAVAEPYDVKTGNDLKKSVAEILKLGNEYGSAAMNVLLDAGENNLDKKEIQKRLAKKSIGRKPASFAKAAQAILDVLDTIDQEPRGYLEAKVYRAVPLTDVALAIVNEEDAGELVDDLETRGVQKVVVARSKDEVDAAIKKYAPRFQVASTAGAVRLGIRNLADAEAMERSGASRLDIWRETGWWRGTEDRKWRVEVGDIDFRPGAFEQLVAWINRGKAKFKAGKFSSKNLPTRADYESASWADKDRMSVALIEEAAAWVSTELYKAEHSFDVHQEWLSTPDPNAKYGSRIFTESERWDNALNAWIKDHPEQAWVDRGPVKALASRNMARVRSGVDSLRTAKAKARVKWGEIAARELKPPATLRELLADDTPILKAYPELVDMPIRFLSGTGRSGGWAAPNEIVLNTSWANENSYYGGRKETLKALAHEIAHHVQRIEDLTRGSNPSSELATIRQGISSPSTLAWMRENVVNSFKDAKSAFAHWLHPFVRKWLRDDFGATIDENDNVAFPQGFDINDGPAIAGRLLTRVNAADEAIQMIPTERFDGLTSGDDSAFLASLDRILPSELLERMTKVEGLRTMGEQSFGKSFEYAKLKQENFDRALEKARQTERELREQADAAYMAAGGEVEARMVEARMGLTADQKKEIPPWVTEEVVRQDTYNHRSDYSYAAQKRAMEEMQWVEESSINDPNGPQYRPMSGEQTKPNQLTFNFIQTPHGVQKQAGVEYPDAGEEIARFQVGAKRRAAYADVLTRKRPDLDADAVLKELDKLDDPKKEKLALHWIVRGTIRLPEDAYKVEDALEVAGKAKVDPFQYGSPMELLEAHREFKPTPHGPIDPDTVPQLTGKTDMGHGVTVYLVQDDAEGQKAMREILNAAYGKEFSPWCLLHGDGKGGLSSQAAHWWGHYSSLPKKVAFLDGKPIAFMATHKRGMTPSELAQRWEEYKQQNGYISYGDFLRQTDISPAEEWWDLKDRNHEGIPATVQVGGDPLGRVHQALIMPDGALKDDSHGWERHSDGVDEEWYGYTYHRKEQTSKGDIDARWYTNGSKGMEVNVRRAGQALPDLVEWARIDNSGNFSYRDAEADVSIHGRVDAGTVISADGWMNETIFKAVRSAGDWKIDTIGNVDASDFRKAFDAWLARFTELTTRPADSIGPEEREHGGRASVAGRVRAFDDEPQYSPRASLAAVATMELLAGREPDRDALEQMRTRLGLEADVDEVIGEAKAVLDSAVGEIARRGAGRNPGAVAVAIAESVQASHPEDLVQEAFRAGANAQKWAQGTRGAALNAIVRNTRGDNYADLVMETGVDATGVLQSFPDMVRRRRADRQDPAPAQAGERPDEATEAKPATAGEPPSLADIGPIDPNSPEGRRIAAIREQQEANIEKAIRETEKEMEQRRLDAWLEDAAKRQKAEADAKAADPDSDDDGGDADLDEGDESGVSDEIKIPVEVLERNLVDASDPETFTLWLRKVVRNRILKANGMSADFQTLKEAQEAEKQLWANPTNVAAFAKSMSAILRDMARRMLDHGSGAYTEVIRKADTLPHYDNVDAIEDEVAFEVGVMSAASISQTSAQLVSETRRKLKRDFIGAAKPNEHPELQDDLVRKITGRVREMAKWYRRVLSLSEAGVDRMREQLEARLEERGRNLDEAGMTEKADRENDAVWDWTNWKLSVLDRFGGTRYLLPAEARERLAEIETWMAREGMAWAQKMEAITRQYEQDRKTIIEGCRVTDKAGRTVKHEEDTKLDKAWRFFVNSIDQRLRLLFARAGGEAGRAAKELRDKTAARLFDATTRYKREKQEMHRALVLSVRNVVGERGVRNWLKRMKQEIPEEQAIALSKQNNRHLTYGQVMHLYGYLRQTATYGENIAKYGREEQRDYIERNVLTAEDIKILDGMMQIYADNRRALDEASRDLTGFPIKNPDPFYLPVKIKQKARSGLETTVSTVQAMPAVFSERRRHGLDVDEKADVMVMFYDRMEQTARVLGMGRTGLDIIHTFGSADVKEAITEARGAKFTTALIAHFTDWMNGDKARLKNKQGEDAEVLNQMRTAFVYMALWGNTLTAFKQTLSAPVFSLAKEVGERGMLRNMMGMFSDGWKQAKIELTQSDPWKARYGDVGLMQETEEAVKGAADGSLWQAILRAGMQPIQWGDATPAILCQVTEYMVERDRLIEGGMQPEEAKRKAATKAMMGVEGTQQSSRPEYLPEFSRRGSSAFRMMTMFASSPMLQAGWQVQRHIEYREKCDAFGKDSKEAQKALAALWRARIVNHVVMPVLFQTATAIFNLALGKDPPDEKDALELIFSMFSGPFARVVFWGGMAKSIYDVYAGTGSFAHSQVAPSMLTSLEQSGKILFGEIPIDIFNGDMDEALADIDKFLKLNVAPYRHGRQAYENWSD